MRDALFILTQQGRFELSIDKEFLQAILPVAKKGYDDEWRSIVEKAKPLCMIGAAKIRAIVDGKGALQLAALDNQSTTIASSSISFALT